VCVELFVTSWITGLINVITVLCLVTFNNGFSTYNTVYCHLIQKSAVYVVDLQTTNGADIELHNLSRPILLDDASPTGGDVKHGDNFKETATFQGSTTHIQGMPDQIPKFNIVSHLRQY